MIKTLKKNEVSSGSNSIKYTMMFNVFQLLIDVKNPDIRFQKQPSKESM